MTVDANELLKRAVEAHAVVLKPDDSDRIVLEESESDLQTRKVRKV